jgi:hypothetical protein
LRQLGLGALHGLWPASPGKTKRQLSKDAPRVRNLCLPETGVYSSAIPDAAQRRSGIRPSAVWFDPSEFRVPAAPTPE